MSGCGSWCAPWSGAAPCPPTWRPRVCPRPRRCQVGPLGLTATGWLFSVCPSVLRRAGLEAGPAELQWRSHQPRLLRPRTSLCVSVRAARHADPCSLGQGILHGRGLRAAATALSTTRPHALPSPARAPPLAQHHLQERDLTESLHTVPEGPGQRALQPLRVGGARRSAASAQAACEEGPNSVALEGM